MIADVLELSDVHRKIVGKLRRRNFYFYLVQCLYENMTQLFCRSLADEVERNGDLDLLSFFEDIKIRVQELACHRVELHIANERVFLIAHAFEGDYRGFPRLAPDMLETAQVYCDRR